MRGRLRSRKALAVVTAAVAGTAIVAAGMPATASAGGNGHGSGGGTDLKPVVTGVDGPRGVSLSPDGKRVIYSSSDGGIYSARVDGLNKGIKKLGEIGPGFGNAIDTNVWGTTYVLTGGGGPEGGPPPPGSATLFRLRPGKSPVAVADIAAYQAHDPDPYNQEGAPTESNPFGVAALRDGTVLVADAAGNDLLRVWPNGQIKTVARLKPRLVQVPDGLPPTDPEGNPLPPAGTPILAEAVATSVTVGSDGYWYVGELRGFPATPGTSQVWRIKPGTTNAVCDPANPNQGKCQRYADGFTSIVDLGAGPKWDQSVYVLELSKASWLQVELGGSGVGALIKVSSKRSHGQTVGGKRTELAPDKLITPGGVQVSKWGQVYVSSPVFGPGGVDKVVP